MTFGALSFVKDLKNSGKLFETRISQTRLAVSFEKQIIIVFFW